MVEPSQGFWNGLGDRVLSSRLSSHSPWSPLVLSQAADLVTSRVEPGGVTSGRSYHIWGRPFSNFELYTSSLGPSVLSKRSQTTCLAMICVQALTERACHIFYHCFVVVWGFGVLVLAFSTFRSSDDVTKIFGTEDDDTRAHLSAEGPSEHAKQLSVLRVSSMR